MIYEFKSRATGTVVTTQDVAERILRIIGKSVQAKGVILPEQMPAAMNALKAAIDSEAKLQSQPQSKALDETQGTAPAKPTAPESGRSEHDGDADEPSVSLKQRAFPFLEMLRDAHSAGKEITWGV